MKFSAVTVIFSKWTLCAAALSGTVAIYGDTCQELFKNGEILRGRRKYAEAQECFRKAAEITEQPADRQALVRLRIGQCYFWMKKYDPAIAEMKKAAAIPGITGYYRSDINAWIGNTYTDMKKYDAAAAAYEQAARLAPASLPQMSFNALMNAASCRKIQGRWSEAAVLIKQASDLRKLPAELRNRALTAIPELFMEARDYAAVIRESRLLVDRRELSAPVRKKLQTMIGKAYFSMQKFEQAKTELKKAETMPDK